MKKLTAVIAGYGMRGSIYSTYAKTHSDELEIVAVAEPIDSRRQSAKERFSITDENLFLDWRDLASKPKLADFAFICTQDNMHLEPAVEFIKKGYNLILEKPMAPTAAECKIIAETAEKYGVKVVVCHVLRFTVFWKKIKEIIDNGDLGVIQSINHTEAVGNTHQSHSFVRGNWRNSKESSPMILAKCCHDADIIQWLIGKDCKKVQSFGSLSYFTPENKPQGAPDRCTDGCPHIDTCPYSAIKLYYDDKHNDWFRSVAINKVHNGTDEEVMEALKTGPYGRCVFGCDNDVVDHQVVNMEFEGGATATLTMNCFNKGGRNIRIYGTKGELSADMGSNIIKVFSFDTRETTEYDLEKIGQDITSGHGGGDDGIMIDSLKYFTDSNPSNSINSVATSYLNHLICFAAEESRLNGTVIDLDVFSSTL